ncbi:hypothetical protein L107_01882 [Cyanobium sp. Copco_Reservoir_LC18]|nr:hypothetical protein L107_01882 [Cyanobium sp. Copco_Reservoir_LC18]
MALRHGAGLPTGGRGRLATIAITRMAMPSQPSTSMPPGIAGGDGTAWVQPFLHQHFVQVGAMAWQGLHRSGRGLVVCGVELPQGRPIHWASEPVPHRLAYWPRGEVTAQLVALGLDTVDHGLLQHALVTYEAGTELVALMLASAEPTIVQLRRMRITPAECHRQLQRRRSEFCGVGR